MVGRGQAMSYEAIVEVQRQRDEKEAAGTGRRGRKRKNCPSAGGSMVREKVRAKAVEEALDETRALGMEESCSVFWFWALELLMAVLKDEDLARWLQSYPQVAKKISIIIATGYPINWRMNEKDYSSALNHIARAKWFRPIRNRMQGCSARLGQRVRTSCNEVDYEGAEAWGALSMTI
jgi:hypothetical protein